MPANRVLCSHFRKLIAFLTTIFLSSQPFAFGEVRLVPQNGHWQLLRDGQPYFIRGGGGNEQAMKSIAAAGGNSIRIWGDDHLGEVLDTAQQAGLTVTAGIWLGQVGRASTGRTRTRWQSSASMCARPF